MKTHKELARIWRFDAFTNPVKDDEQFLKNFHIYGYKITGITEPDVLIGIVLSFDVGHHACGWWKNADYDRCLHLSLSVNGERKGNGWSYFDDPQEMPANEVNEWAKLIFEDLHPDALKWLWFEPGYKGSNMKHLRLFYSKITGQPIMPEGEVYNLKPWGDGTDPEKVM